MPIRKLSGTKYEYWTIRYVTLHFRDRRGSAFLRYRKSASQSPFFVPCEQKLYLFSNNSVGSCTFPSIWLTKKDERDNGLTSPPKDAIIWTETRSWITASIISPVFLKTLVVNYFGRGLNPPPNARQTGALSTELTGRQFEVWDKSLYCLLGMQWMGAQPPQ